MAIYYVATYCLSKKKTNSRWAINIAMLKKVNLAQTLAPQYRENSLSSFTFLVSNCYFS